MGDYNSDSDSDSDMSKAGTKNIKNKGEEEGYNSDVSELTLSDWGSQLIFPPKGSRGGVPIGIGTSGGGGGGGIAVPIGRGTSGGGGGGQSLSRGNSLSTNFSTFSQQHFNALAEPNQRRVYDFEPTDQIELDQNGKVISGTNQNGAIMQNIFPTDFANDTNALLATLQNNVERIIEDEDDDITTISTGLTKTVHERPQLIASINAAIQQYTSDIVKIVPIDATESQISTQTNQSTQSAITVLSQLKTPAIVSQIITTTVLNKKKLAPEFVDFTFTKCFYNSTSFQEILYKNNRFSLLKFCCANGIPISGQINYIDPISGQIISVQINKKSEKIYYSIKELEWMLEQGASAKGTTRQLRYDALFFCLQNRFAIQLFDIIYNLFSVWKTGAFIKICAVGGNLLRAFFLVLRYARNKFNGTPNDTNEDVSAAFTGWTEEQIMQLGQFAATIPNLDDLCKKSSDTDLSSYKIMSAKEKRDYGPHLEEALMFECLRENFRIAKYTERHGPLPESPPTLKCSGPIEFPLIRMKTPVFENGQHYEQTCGHIINNSETIREANRYFPQIKWFAQMIPDNSVELLDNILTKKPPDPVFAQIKILYCTLQEVKKHNALLTSTNSDEISLGRFKELSQFTIKCCEIFFTKISPQIKATNNLQDIQQIVEKITPFASDAMFSLLEDETIYPVVNRVLLKLNNYHYLSQSCGIHLFSDANGENIPTKSTAIAIGNTNKNISDIHKRCSFDIRSKLSNLRQPINGVCFSINCLRITESLSMEDIKDREFNEVVVPSGGGGGAVAAALSGMGSTASIMTTPTQISSTIYRGALPSGGGGGGGGFSLLKLETQASLEKLAHTALYNKCVSNGTKGHVQYKKSNPYNTQQLINLLLAKQKENGTLLGGSKTRKHRHRKTRKHGIKNQRRTRRF